jgi:hypothetical protein
MLWAVIGVTACTAVPPTQPSAPAPLAPAGYEPVAAPAAPDPVIALRFAWPREGSVQVKETVRRKGHTAEFSYELAWSPDEQGGFVMEHRDHRCTGLDGVAIDAATASMMLAASGFEGIGNPRMRISAAGELVELLDMDQFLEPLIGKAIEAPGIPEEERQEIATVMRSEGARSLFEAPSRQQWHAWAGAWCGEVVNPAAPATREEESPSAFGTTLKSTVRIEADPPATVDGRRQIRLRRATVFDPASLTEAALSMPALAMTARAQALHKDEAQRVGRMERQDDLEVLTDPDTLIPLRVLRRSLRTVFDKSGASMETVKEQYLYEFEWPD